MRTKLIVMLTYNDRTLSNARDIFESCADLDVEFWGFKDVGLPHPEMKMLVEAMKAAGKTTFLEVVSYTEEECMIGAKAAVEFGFDYLMGTIFYEKVWEYIKRNGVKYLPFVGTVSGSPSVLEGEIPAIIAEGEKLVERGVDGFDLLAYRHVTNPEGLARRFTREIDAPVVIAGSINSAEQIDLMEEMGAWAFTIGSALVNSEFVDGSFRDNLAFVVDYMKR